MWWNTFPTEFITSRRAFSLIKKAVQRWRTMIGLPTLSSKHGDHRFRSYVREIRWGLFRTFFAAIGVWPSPLWIRVRVSSNLEFPAAVHLSLVLIRDLPIHPLHLKANLRFLAALHWFPNINLRDIKHASLTSRGMRGVINDRLILNVDELMCRGFLIKWFTLNDIVLLLWLLVLQLHGWLLCVVHSWLWIHWCFRLGVWDHMLRVRWRSIREETTLSTCWTNRKGLKLWAIHR